MCVRACRDTRGYTTCARGVRVYAHSCMRACVGVCAHIPIHECSSTNFSEQCHKHIPILSEGYIVCLLSLTFPMRLRPESEFCIVCVRVPAEGGDIVGNTKDKSFTIRLSILRHCVLDLNVVAHEV